MTRTSEDLDRIEAYLKNVAERVAAGETIGEAIDVTHDTPEIEKRAEAYLVGAQFKLEREGDAVGAKNANRIITVALRKVADDRANETRAVVRTWNDAEASWGPMTLAKAIGFAADTNGAHRYVEVAGRIVFDMDDVEATADAALRAEKVEA